MTPGEKQTLFLEEYRNCSEKVSRLDSLIWQTAAIIFPVGLAGYTIFGLSTNHTSEQFFVLLGVAIGSIALLITWFLLSRAWYRYQQIAFYRMREIETELGLWHYRYALFLRKPEVERKKVLHNTKNKDEKKQLQELEEHVGGASSIGLRITITLITILFIMGWIALVMREFLLTF